MPGTMDEAHRSKARLLRCDTGKEGASVFWAVNWGQQWYLPSRVNTPQFTGELLWELSESAQTLMTGIK